MAKRVAASSGGGESKRQHSISKWQWHVKNLEAAWRAVSYGGARVVLYYRCCSLVCQQINSNKLAQRKTRTVCIYAHARLLPSARRAPQHDGIK